MVSGAHSSLTAGELINYCGKTLFVTAALSVLLVPRISFASEIEEISALKLKVDAQEATIQQQQRSIQQLLDKMAMLETKLERDASSNSVAQDRVNLELEEVASLPLDAPNAHVLGRPWYQNIRVGGFGAGGFVWTGGEGNKEHGSFLNYEATLEVEANVWEGVDYFHELQTIRMGDESTKFVRTGEVYVHLKDTLLTLFDNDNMPFGTKIGRMDIPFGEDYLTMDVTDNPLITYAAAYPYGYDEGLIFYGKAGGLGWVAAIMDGTDDRAFEDNADKFLSLKLYGNASEDLYLSASGFYNGESSKSAWELGGSHFEPVGTGSGSAGTSSAGSSTSDSVDAFSYELDAQYALGNDRYFKLQYGAVRVDDDASVFDRTIHYFQIEPKWNLGASFDNKVYIIGRASAVGTFDEDNGYHFDGKPFAGGSSAFGYDTKALYRWALGLGYWPNPRTLVKLEYSRDDFQMIAGSTLDDGSEQRDLFGLLVATKF